MGQALSWKYLEAKRLSYGAYGMERQGKQVIKN